MRGKILLIADDTNITDKLREGDIIISVDRSNSRDSGSHSRPGSAALVVDYTSKDQMDK